LTLSSSVQYPIIAIGDLHGHRYELERLIARLERLTVWPQSALVFLGDFVDRGPDVKGTLDLVLHLLERSAGGSAVMGNHDLALVRAARLDDGPHSDYWVERYREFYDHNSTFESYLGRSAELSDRGWLADLAALRMAMPAAHRAFLSTLPWLVEATGHLFLHCGLSGELRARAEEQVEALHHKRWDRTPLRPEPRTDTDLLWQDEYPVWIGADRKLSPNPLPHPRKIQVTGHVYVPTPDVGPHRIRIDTVGGPGRPTACLLRAPQSEPVFIQA
jgi:serine/threonine protein phosphatase 1